MRFRLTKLAPEFLLIVLVLGVALGACTMCYAVWRDAQDRRTLNEVWAGKPLPLGTKVAVMDNGFTMANGTVVAVDSHGTYVVRIFARRGVDEAHFRRDELEVIP